jgi:hypothetical protein
MDQWQTDHLQASEDVSLFEIHPWLNQFDTDDRNGEVEEWLSQFATAYDGDDMSTARNDAIDELMRKFIETVKCSTLEQVANARPASPHGSTDSETADNDLDPESDARYCAGVLLHDL